MNLTQLYEVTLALCMRVVCHVHRLGLICTSKQNVLSLILLISLAELTNQKMGICRHHILYPLQLGPPFSNNRSTIKPKIGLGPNLMKIDLRKVCVENITFFWKNKTIFGKERPLETLNTCIHAYAYTH